ncbi:unnamed protein product, partial [Laminaria digitata]
VFSVISCSSGCLMPVCLVCCVICFSIFCFVVLLFLLFFSFPVLLFRCLSLLRLFSFAILFCFTAHLFSCLLFIFLPVLLLYPALAGLHPSSAPKIQTNRERDFAAQWQGDAAKLQNLNPADRDALAVNLRQALGKTPKSKKKKTSSKKSSKTSSPVASAAPPGGAINSSVAGGGKGFGSGGAGGVRGRGVAEKQRERRKGNDALGDDAEATSSSAPENATQRVVSFAADGGNAEGTRFSDGVAAVLGRKESVTASAGADAGVEGTPDTIGTGVKDAP